MAYDTVFANCSEDDKIYSLTTAKIASAQRADATYKHLFKRNVVFDQGLEIKLIKNTLCVCKDGRLVIPEPLQRHVVMWHHHYLQHPGHTHLEMNAVMYWKSMCTTIRSITKSCKTCQVRGCTQEFPATQKNKQKKTRKSSTYATIKKAE